MAQITTKGIGNGISEVSINRRWGGLVVRTQHKNAWCAETYNRRGIRVATHSLSSKKAAIDWLISQNRAFGVTC